MLFDDLTGDKEIKPSLLHGDLWSGNIGSADGKPSIYDPAVYWGHHEAEWGVSYQFALKGVITSCGVFSCSFFVPVCFISLCNGELIFM